MMRGRGRALLLAGLLAGCGSSAATPSPDGSPPDDSVPITDISGWYQVTSDLAGPCGATTTDPVPIPYVWMERNLNHFYFNVCTGPTQAQCTGSLFYDFMTPIDNGLSAVGGSAFYSAGCTLTVERDQATLIGDQLMVHSLKDSINEDIPEAQCTLDAALALQSPCTYQMDILATKLATAP